jgi:ATP-dependent Clp protease ATP-binding subunit ClpA
MLMGMLHVQGGKIGQLLAASKIPAPQLVQTLRDSLKNRNDISNQEEKMQPHGGIRPNVSAMLTRAREIAEKQGREAIGEPDLLEALLDMRFSGAYILLDFVVRKLTKKSLGLLTNRSFKEKIFNDDGNLCPESFDQDIIKALEQAVKEAGNLNWADIRSPHLALGILARDNSPVVAYALETGQSLKKLIARMRSDLQKDIPVNERLRLERRFFSENGIKYLMIAAEKAEMEGSSRVEEKHLWRAILEDVTGIFYLILARQISPAALLPVGW